MRVRLNSVPPQPETNGCAQACWMCTSHVFMAPKGPACSLLLPRAQLTPPHNPRGLTISKFPKFGKALEGGPCLGCECHAAVPGPAENMVALGHLGQARQFLEEDPFQPVAKHVGEGVAQLGAWKARGRES